MLYLSTHPAREREREVLHLSSHTRLIQVLPGHHTYLPRIYYSMMYLGKATSQARPPSQQRAPPRAAIAQPQHPAPPLQPAPRGAGERGRGRGPCRGAARRPWRGGGPWP